MLRAVNEPDPEMMLRMDLTAIALEYNVPRHVARVRLTKAVSDMKRDAIKKGRILHRVIWSKNERMTMRTKAIVGALLFTCILLMATPAHAQGGANFPYGANCQGCGIPGDGSPNNIITSTINCTLGDGTTQCQSNSANYPTLASSTDITEMIWSWQTTTSASGCVVLGAILNTTDRTFCQVDGSGNYVISTSHTVTIHHLVPAAALGNAGNTVGFTVYLASSTSGSTSNPGGTSPGANYGNGWSAWPGPVGITQGPTAYMDVFAPNPQALFPMQWELTAPGVQTAVPGYPSMIPLLLIWKGGNATTVAGLGAVQPADTVAHTYSSTYSAPNSGIWQVSNGTAWVSQGGGTPQWLASATITQGGNTYICSASSTGGVNLTTYQPDSSTCKTSGGADSGIVVVPFYAGQVGSAGTDYRSVQYSSAHAAYYMNMNAAAPPLNPQPTSVMEVFPGIGAITGSMTVNLTLTLYTDATLATVATGTTPVTVSYPITVAAVTPVTQSTPAPSTDAELPAYFAYNAMSMVGIFTNQGIQCSMDNWNIADKTYMWYPFGAGSFAECQTWNYDNSRMATNASDIFLRKMDGTAWPTTWMGTHTYGDNYADEVICPSSDSNSNCWVATNNTCLTGGGCGFTSGSSEPVWNSHSVAGSIVSDGSGSWINAGNQAYWNRNVENSGQPYLNNVLLTNGAAGQYAQFSGALWKNVQRTDDAVLKGTPSGEQTVTGLYSAAVKALPNGDAFGGAFSPFSDDAGRGAAYELMSIATYWREVCREGDCAAFTGNTEFKRLAFYELNSGLNYLDLFSHQPEFSTNESQSYGPVIIPFYTGVTMEADDEWFTTCHDLDPSNTTGICGDARIWPYLKLFTGYAWTHWWDQSFVAGEGVHNYSFSYDPRDIQNHTIIEPFFTELTGPVEPAYPVMFAYCGGDTVNCLLPDGTHYDVASNVIREHQFDGRNCNNWTCTGSGHFYGRVWNGGVPNGFGTQSPKQSGQANKWGMGNDYQNIYGYQSYTTDDLSPSRNPCWTTQSGPCAITTPYADTQPPYMWAYITPGSSGQDDPSAEGHFTGRTDSPIYAFTSTSASIQTWSYEWFATARINYGPNSACNAGSVTTEDAGYPQSPSYSVVSTYLHHWTLTGLTPSTQIYLQFCAVDAAGNQACNSCSAQSIGQGGGINFTTLASTGPVILTTTLPTGSVGTAYSTTLLGSGGFPPYTFTVTGTLPSGLSFTSPTISGTPTGTGGNYPLTLGMSDSHGTFATPVNTSITITDCNIITASLPAATFGVAYSQTLTASVGCIAPLTWGYILSLLPPGLGLNSATGVISGTPTACSTYNVHWTVTDSETPAVTASKLLPITVGGCGGSLTLTCPTFPGGVVNDVYPTQSCTIAGGVSPYTCSISSGSLPAGLNVGTSGSTCTITGTPTATGTSTFNVHVHDSTGTPLTADSPGSITIISTGQLGVTINGSTTATGSVTIGTPNP